MAIRMCQACKGKGYLEGKCPRCKGKGKINVGWPIEEWIECPKCQGTGNAPCPNKCDHGYIRV